jgi:hypothetical protein
MIFTQTAYRSFARAFVFLMVSLHVVATAMADAITLKRGNQSEEYWGKITAIDNNEVILDLECKGNSRRFTWAQLGPINFSKGCRPASWFAAGGFDLECKRGQSPRTVFVVVDRTQVEIVADSVSLQGDRITFKLLNGTSHSYNRNTDVLDVLRTTGC